MKKMNLLGSMAALAMAGIAHLASMATAAAKAALNVIAPPQPNLAFAGAANSATYHDYARASKHQGKKAYVKPAHEPDGSGIMATTSLGGGTSLANTHAMTAAKDHHASRHFGHYASAGKTPISG